MPQSAALHSSSCATACALPHNFQRHHCPPSVEPTAFLRPVSHPLARVPRPPVCLLPPSLSSSLPPSHCSQAPVHSMYTLLVLAVLFALFFDTAAATSPLMDPTMPAMPALTEPFYPDPDGMLAAVCGLCGYSIEMCLHSQHGQVPTLRRTLNLPPADSHSPIGCSTLPPSLPRPSPSTQTGPWTTPTALTTPSPSTTLCQQNPTSFPFIPLPTKSSHRSLTRTCATSRRTPRLCAIAPSGSTYGTYIPPAIRRNLPHDD